MDFVTAFKLIVLGLTFGIILFELARFIGSKVFHFSDICRLLLEIKNKHSKRTKKLADSK